MFAPLFDPQNKSHTERRASCYLSQKWHHSQLYRPLHPHPLDVRLPQVQLLSDTISYNVNLSNFTCRPLQQAMQITVRTEVYEKGAKQPSEKGADAPHSESDEVLDLINRLAEGSRIELRSWLTIWKHVTGI